MLIWFISPDYSYEIVFVHGGNNKAYLSVSYKDNVVKQSDDRWTNHIDRLVCKRSIEQPPVLSVMISLKSAILNLVEVPLRIGKSDIKILNKWHWTKNHLFGKISGLVESCGS